MSLRALAEADLAATLEDPTGYGWPVTVTAPDGTSGVLSGQTQDVVEQLLDPDTGQGVNMRTASVTLRLSSLVPIFGDLLPQAVPQQGKRPWTFEFDDAAGKHFCWAVRRSRPDRTLGVITLHLEAWAS